MKEISNEDFAKIVRKVIRLIDATKDPVKHAEIAKE
jgi:hypothetical protein